MYAVILAGGKQFKVSVGDTIYVDKLAAEDGASVEFNALLVADGDQITVGTPVVDGVKVTGEVERQVKGKKVISFRYKAKKNVRVKNGHRQPYTKVVIKAIG